MANVSFSLNGTAVSVDSQGTLLTALRDHLRIPSVKDGCAPQGQCGCCTVWVDGEPRVSCVTPVQRVDGRVVTTVEGLDVDVRQAWGEAMCATGGSQCGFCTPGIIMRLEAGKDLLAHMCRCTGWQTINEAVRVRRGEVVLPTSLERDLGNAQRRAEIEGRAPQVVGPLVALGAGGFADDIAPHDALVAVPSVSGEWLVGETTADARRAAATVQGRKSSLSVTYPVVFPGDFSSPSFVHTLQTTWVEPAYLEPDAVWCQPGGKPVGPLLNGGAFGAKSITSELALELQEVARRLANKHQRPVRVVLSREDVVRRSPKRPPMALAVRSDGSGEVWVARTSGLVDIISDYAPKWLIHEIDVDGPATSVDVRAAGWAEVAVMKSSVSPETEWGDYVVSPEGAQAWARVDDSGIHVRVQCGLVLDAVVLRSYCIGAAHMGLGWVRSEGIAVNESGEPVDLTIRSFGVIRAVDTPSIDIEIIDNDGPSINGSDAVFAAVAAAAWRAAGFPSTWPCQR
jgi:aerobic-type carbon monoxide dehydrogenase small subunit (CoxS/CutS family)